MRILVSGITGRIGANVAKRFADMGHEITGFVFPGDSQADKVAQIGADIVEGDLASSRDVANAADGAKAIFHLGAAFQAGGPFTPEQYFDINVKGTFNVLEAALSNRVKHVVVTSTDGTMEKYPPNGIEKPISRGFPCRWRATGWYGYTKVLTEHLVDRYVRAESLPATVIRFANAWGAGEALDFPQFHMRTFMRQLEKFDTHRRQSQRTRRCRKRTMANPHLIIAADHNGRPWKKHLDRGQRHRPRLRESRLQTKHLRQRLPNRIEPTLPVGSHDPLHCEENRRPLHQSQPTHHANLLRIRHVSSEARLRLRSATLSV